MQMRMGWNHLFEVAQGCKIIKKIGQLIKKKPNAVHTAEQTTETMFKGFLQNIRVHHFQLKNVTANISTYYRDLRRCDSNSYRDAQKIVEDFYVQVKKKRKVVITIDGTFIGLWGKKFEKAAKMYSGNKKDKGKRGYTIVTGFDAVNKLPIGFKVPLIHELHAVSPLIMKAVDLEKQGEIVIRLFVLDALYFNKEMFDLLSGYQFIIRAPAQDWLLQYVDETQRRGQKEITLWGQSVVLHWRPSKKEDQQFDLILTNTAYTRVWRVYGHYKQMVENYHDDLKNKFGIRKLPSRKLHAILVYFCIIILLYMLARAVLLGIGMNRLSCGTVLLVASLSLSGRSLISNLLMLGRKKKRRCKPG